jgi:hypothetical protein
MLRTVYRGLGLVLLTVSVACGPRSAPAGTVLWFEHNGHSYEIVKTARTWAAAAADAVSRHYPGVPSVTGALVRIDDAAENAAVYSHINDAILSTEYSSTAAPDGGGSSYVWIGATDRVTEGDWIWDGDANNVGDPFWSGNYEGSPVGGRYSNWGTVDDVQHEPDNYVYLGTDQDAAGMALNGWPKSDQHLGSASQWNDVRVVNNLYYVVEYPVPEPAAASLLFGVGLFGVGLLIAAAPGARRR